MCKSNTTREEATENTYPAVGTHQGMMLQPCVVKNSWLEGLRWVFLYFCLAVRLIKEWVACLIKKERFT